MDEIERLIRDARPQSGTRDRPLSERAERELDALVGQKRHRRILPFALAAVAATALAVGIPLWHDDPAPRLVAGPAEVDPAVVLRAAATKLGVPQTQFVADEAESLLDGQDFSLEAQAFLLASIERNGSAIRAKRGIDRGYAVWKVTLVDGELVIRIDTGQIVVFVDGEGIEHRP